MSQRTNEADIAAVTETVRAYYDGSLEGDEAKLARAFHPRACIVGNEHGELYWATLDEYVAECKKAVAEAGPHEWRIDGLSFEGDTALVRLGASTPACGTATICPCSGSTALGASSTRRSTHIPEPDVRNGSRGYDPSQQNTFTGKLTRPMLKDVLARAQALADQAST